jgi:hypothetical protein
MRVQIAANSGNLREEYWRTLEFPCDCLPHFLPDYCKLIYTRLGADGVNRGYWQLFTAIHDESDGL